MAAPNQAITIALDGAVQIDLSAIANTPVTFVQVGNELVILFDNKATVALAPFFGNDGTPLSSITVEVAPDRSVSGTEFASLFPITQDQSVLPTAGNGPPGSGADFTTATREHSPSKTPSMWLQNEREPLRDVSHGAW